MYVRVKMMLNQVEERRRKASVREAIINDLTQWRKDVVPRQDVGRGRRLELSF